MGIPSVCSSLALLASFLFWAFLKADSTGDLGDFVEMITSPSSLLYLSDRLVLQLRYFSDDLVGDLGEEGSGGFAVRISSVSSISSLVLLFDKCDLQFGDFEPGLSFG